LISFVFPLTPRPLDAGPIVLRFFGYRDHAVHSARAGGWFLPPHTQFPALGFVELSPPVKVLLRLGFFSIALMNPKSAFGVLF